MAKIIAALIRHGAYDQLPQVPSAHQPFALTDDGRRQAERGAQELLETADRHGWTLVQVIDSSRMLRAWQTAQILVDKGAGTIVESFDALAERGLGCAANLTVSQIEDILRDDPRAAEPPINWKADSYYQLPLQGAESLLQAGKRIAKHIAQRTAAATNSDSGDDQVKIFIGHGAAFRHAAFHLGALEFEQIAGLSMHHGRPVFLERTTDNRWCHIAGDWKIRPAGIDARD